MSTQAMITRRLLKKAGIWNKPLSEIRQTMAGIKGGGVPAGIVSCAMSLGGVNCEVFRHADDAPRRTVLYFHGGGFCLGIYNANRSFVAGLAQQLDADIYLPDYRLAPEHAYPAALDDARSVLQALSGCSRLIVMGDSSGCALALSALQGQSVSPQAIVMITPVLDLTNGQTRIAQSVRKDPFHMDDPLTLTKKYAAGNNPAAPAISPIYGELKNFPPMLIHAAQFDAFLSDAVRFKEKADGAGCAVTLKVWPKMWHIFHMQAPFVPEAARAISEIKEFVQNF